MTKALRRSWLDDDDDDEDWDEEEESCGPDNFEVDGPSYAAVFTGLLKPNGDPIIRHPIVLRTGFHPKGEQYHCPTLEETDFAEDPGKVFGWVYE